MKEPKGKKRYAVVVGNEIAYKNRHLFACRIFQNNCGEPKAKIVQIRVMVPYREPKPQLVEAR